MPEWLKNFLDKIKEWWLKFTTRQKAIIIGLSLVAVVVFIVIISVVSRPQYVTLITCETTQEASKVTGILTDSAIEYDISNNALVIKVRQEDLANAELALGASGYKPDSYSLADSQNNSLSDTMYDKRNRNQLYLETKLANDLKAIDGIRNAKVNLHIPEDNGTLIAKNEESSAYIQLTTDVSFNAGNATYLAKAVACFLGNETTANITILDEEGNMLFIGGDDYTQAGIANSMQELQSTAEAYIANQVKKVLYGTNQYNNVEVASHLDMDYATYEETVKLYYPNDDRTEGMIAHQETYDSENESGAGGVPGTDSNGEGQTYVFQNGNNSSSSSSEKVTDYLPNEKGTYSTIPAGVVDYSKSSLSIAVIRYNELTEKDAKTKGLLDGISWAEYKLANSKDTKLEVDADFYSMVSTATGVPVESITIVAYESPVFYDNEGISVNWTTVLSAALFLLLLALLIVVVIRSMSSKKEEVQEEEVSVENLLQSTPEPVIEDIDVETKSETRKMVEKFVDENPESAALLLRNWLDEEW
ncbi:MAG: flagellar M-ring protein FliF [Lachnospiraceae bacterium]|nr:flagellar M-ring protein FliF [Lachnospiraceae bacterium]